LNMTLRIICGKLPALPSRICSSRPTFWRECLVLDLLFGTMQVWRDGDIDCYRGSDIDAGLERWRHRLATYILLEVATYILFSFSSQHLVAFSLLCPFLLSPSLSSLSCSSLSLSSHSLASHSLWPLSLWCLSLWCLSLSFLSQAIQFVCVFVCMCICTHVYLYA